MLGTPLNSDALAPQRETEMLTGKVCRKAWKVTDSQISQADTMMRSRKRANQLQGDIQKNKREETQLSR